MGRFDSIISLVRQGSVLLGQGAGLHPGTGGDERARAQGLGRNAGE